jgi:hypothetical protein
MSGPPTLSCVHGSQQEQYAYNRILMRVVIIIMVCLCEMERLDEFGQSTASTQRDVLKTAATTSAFRILS